MASQGKIECYWDDEQNNMVFTKKNRQNERMKHKTVTVELGGFKEEIDESIAPLIKKLWDLKIRTVNSCENNVPEGWIWIEFANSSHAEKFLNIVAEYDEDPNNLYNRICQEWSLDDKSLFWKYDVRPMDCGVEQTLVNDKIEEKFIGKSDFIFTFSIRFPQSDLEQVMNRLTKCETIPLNLES